MPRQSPRHRLFRALLRLFPAEFRGDFGEQMTADFEDQHRDAGAHPPAIRRLWLRTAVDMLSRAPREHLDILWRDVVYALRSLRRHPGPTAVAVLSLALGIGLNSAVFSVVHGVIWRDLPFPESDRLVQIGLIGPDEMLLSPMYTEVREQLRTLDRVAAATPHPLVFVEPGEPQQVSCARIGEGFFETLGARPLLGRTFERAEYDQARVDLLRSFEQRSSRPPPRVVMLGDGIWRRAFHADPDVVGRRVVLAGGSSAEIVGVMGPEADVLPGTFAGTACWMPEEPDAVPALVNLALVVGRLAPGVSLQTAQSELDALQTTLAMPAARAWNLSGDPRSLGIGSLHERTVGDVRPQLLLLFGAVVCVLLVTGANVANLLLARAAGRRAERATRVALGASRGRLVRHTLTESMVLTLVGGTSGLLVALWAVPVFTAWAPADVPRLADVGLRWPTVVFTIGVMGLVGIGGGVLAALPEHRRTGALLHPSAGRATPRMGRLRQVLAVGEIALALVLVVGSTLMVRSVRELGAVPLGFDPTGVVDVALPAPPGPFDLTRTQWMHQTAVEQVRALPGVRAAGVGLGPLKGGMGLGGLRVPGDPREFDGIRVDAVSPGYFEALGIRLLAGRFFEDRDTSGGGAAPIVINETAARTFFGTADPIGRAIESAPLGGEQVVIGLAADLREASLETGPGPTIYQVSTRSSAFLANAMLVKVDGDVAALIPAIRSIVRSINADAPFDGVAPLQARIDRETAPRRFVLRVIGLFSLLGLVLAVIGVYGVLAESVTQRVPEIGIRRAFGATTGDVVRLVLRQGWRLAAVGIPLGLAGAAALSGTMRAHVYGVSTLDALTYATAALCLLLATVAACALPARRAARLDPVAALRAE